MTLIFRIRRKVLFLLGTIRSHYFKRMLLLINRPGVNIQKWYLGKGFNLDIKSESFQIAIGDLSCRNYCTILLSGGSLKIGHACFMSNHCSINCLGKIEIGDDVIFGEGVRLYDHDHRFREAEIPISDQGYAIDPIIIGRNCWLGSNVLVMKGVTIGDNVVVGAGEIVRESIPPNVVYVDRKTTARRSNSNEG